MKRTTLLKTMLLLCALIVGSNSLWAADVTITMSQQGWSNSTAIGSGTLKSAVGVNSIFTYSSGTGSDEATEGPKYFDSGSNVRFYSLKNGTGQGNWMQINVPANTTITGVEITGVSTYTPDVKYNVDGGSDVSWTASDDKYTVSGISATSSFKFRNAYKSSSDNKQLRITAIKITYTPSHTLTYSATNGSISGVVYNTSTVVASGASVLEGGKVTLTATPASASYVFSSWSVSGTGSTISSTTDNPATFTMGTANTTVTANFVSASSTKYVVTFSAPSNGTLVIKKAGVAISSGDEITEGTTLTIVATPNDGYNFEKWEYSTDGGSSWTDGVGTTYEVTSAVQFRASFVAKVYHTITYSVNGTETPVSVEEGEAISFAAPVSGIPTGYTFKGWRTSTLALTDTNPNDYVTSGTSTADITYYAVMAAESINSETETLTQSEITTNLTNTTCAYGTEKNFTDGDITWTISAYTDANNRPWMQMKKSSDSYIKITAPGKITGLTFTITSATNEKGGIADITKHTDYSDYIYVDTSAKSTPTGGLGSTNTISSDQMSLSPTGNNTVVYMQVGSGARVWGIEVTYNATTVSNYCTTVPTTTVSVGASKYASFCSASALNFTDCDVKAYKAKVTDSKVVLTQVNEVPANEGVILYGEEGNYNVTVIASASAVSENELIGVTARTLVEWTTGGDGKKNYILQAGQFKKAATGGYLKANRAYLHTSYDVTSAGAHELEMVFDGEQGSETTGISEVNTKKEFNGEFFNLAGQKVQNPTKGLYIVNGKKVIIR